MCSKTTLSEESAVRNGSNTGEYIELIQDLRGNHIEYILASEGDNDKKN
jgi:hypothetical protein